MISKKELQGKIEELQGKIEKLELFKVQSECSHREIEFDTCFSSWIGLYHRYKKCKTCNKILTYYNDLDTYNKARKEYYRALADEIK
jgi:hypothetical protein